MVLPAGETHGTGAVLVGGVGTVGGIVYPLVYSAPFLPNFHVGYAIVAVSMLPIVMLAGWVFRPHIAKRATESGFVGADDPAATAAPADDD